jgi:hypothetical protein
MDAAILDVKNEDIAIDLFERYKKTLESELKSCQIVHPASYDEIIPLLFVLAGYVYASLGESGEFPTQCLTKWVNRYIRTPAQRNWLHERAAFYGAFIRGRKVRGEWRYNKADDREDDPVVRCVIAFGDILMNPDCVANYKYAPLMLSTAREITTFADAMKGVKSACAAFCDAIADRENPAPVAAAPEQSRLVNDLMYAVQFTTENGMKSYLRTAANRADWRERSTLNRILNGSGNLRLLVNQAIRALLEGDDPASDASAQPTADIVRINEANRRDPENGDDGDDAASLVKDWSDRLLSENRLGYSIHMYKRMTVIRPDSFGSWYDLGCAFLKNGHYVWAKDAFRKALSIIPNDIKALRNVAFIQYQLREYDEALATLAHYLALNDDDQAVGLWRKCKELARDQDFAQMMEK